MEHIIKIDVNNKIAVADKTEYVCSNGDYVVHFNFDDDWKEYSKKTARFKWGRRHKDVVFDGNVCRVPKMRGADIIFIGVYAGDLKTTTPAYVKARKSILCGDSYPDNPEPDVYNQLMELINKNMNPSADAIIDALGYTPAPQKLLFCVAHESGKYTLMGTDGTEHSDVTGDQFSDMIYGVPYSVIFTGYRDNENLVGTVISVSTQDVIIMFTDFRNKQNVFVTVPRSDYVAQVEYIPW